MRVLSSPRPLLDRSVLSVQLIHIGVAFSTGCGRFLPLCNKNREKLISEAKASNGGEKPIRERMAVITIHPKPFFADKNRAFWNLQSLGWFGALIMRSEEHTSELPSL